MRKDNITFKWTEGGVTRRKDNINRKELCDKLDSVTDSKNAANLIKSKVPNIISIYIDVDRNNIKTIPSIEIEIFRRPEKIGIRRENKELWEILESYMK